MLTRKKIEKLYLQCFNASEDGRTWHNHQKFARLVEAEALRNVAQRFNRGYLDTLCVADELEREASAARRAAKEGR